MAGPRLRTKLFGTFAVLIMLFGLLSAWHSVGLIRRRVVAEAQNQVRLNLVSAWSVYQARQELLATVITMAAGSQVMVEAGRSDGWDEPAVRERLEIIRMRFGLDFLTVVDRDGMVVARASPPYKTGESRLHHPAVARALGGERVVGTELLAGVDLEREAEGLAERAYIVLETTPYARPTPRTAENRGMVMIAAIPIEDGSRVAGAIYGGVLLNRNADLIDAIKSAVYKDDTYEGVRLGTATIFLHDSRVTTTVRLPNGNRALGTRVSKEVADRVLDNGEPWIGPAFVVKDWYLTAYEPIRDLQDHTIGMLYVGILEKPFRLLGRNLIWRYVFLTLVGVVIALGVAFVGAGRLSRPIRQLVDATRKMHAGEYPEPIRVKGASAETDALVVAFNEMSQALRERETSLNEANRSLTAVNHSYMETLSFVTHELNTPLASMMNYIYLLGGGRIGDLNEKQTKAIRSLDHNARRLTEMVRHYLNLARIERGELRPTPILVAVAKDVVEPLLEAAEPQLAERKMTVRNAIGGDLRIRADVNMTREVFENLFSNAIKYGRAGGEIRISAERLDGFIRFHVWNDGEGVAPDKLATLFDKFSRPPGGAAGKERGTGLGLFITRNIVEGHGGSITVDAREHEWIEFTFTLPVGREAAG